MTGTEKVIKGLECCMVTDNDIACADCPYNDPTTFEYGENGCLREKLMPDAIKLLKEQEAKQVIRKQRKKEHDDGSIDFFAEWYCPHCNMLILRGFDNPSIKFCYKCGKPILWKGR